MNNIIYIIIFIENKQLQLKYVAISVTAEVQTIMNSVSINRPIRVSSNDL